MADISKMTDWDKLEEMLDAQRDKGKEREIDRQLLADHMRSRVKGQDHVIDDMAKLIYLQMLKTERSKPVASLLFLGPTGVGKTELAKAITEYLYKDENAMLRFDCSEYKSPESRTGLIGSPPGYVDHEKGGKLTRPVLVKKQRLIVFDEIEKADPGIFDLFLQMLGEGRLTESTGQTADYKECVVILTSNSEVDAIVKIQEEVTDYYDMVNAVKSHLAEAKVFRPEILGRIDRIYVFKPLEPRVMAEITLMKIGQLAKSYGMTVHHVAPELVIQALVSNAKVARFGVRELDRVVENMLGAQMVEARIGKVRVVNLATNANGEIEITPAFDS